MRNELRREFSSATGAAAHKRRPIALGVLLGVVGLLVSLLPATFALEERLGLGLLFTLRGPLPPPSEVAVVGISGESAAALGLSTELDTWSRSEHAALVDRLAMDGASVVAFDLLFFERREGSGDAALAAAIERAGNVVLAFSVDGK